MKIVVPMAGLGTRMRPHTLTVPKPLIKLAGKSIVQRLIEGIAESCQEPIEEIAYIIGNFGSEVEKQLKLISDKLGAKTSIYYQEQALGTAHAVWCAKESLTGKTVVAFADTLFFNSFKLNTEADGIIWVKKIDKPELYGVVSLNDKNEILGFVEKPKTFVSDLAIIGIYYFKEAEVLKSELQNMMDNKILKDGEYQLTTALENLREKNCVFISGEVDEWLDCGNKEITINTHKRILEKSIKDVYTSKSAKLNNSIIINPCNIGNNVELNNSIIGPYVSIGDNTILNNVIVENSIIQNNTKLSNLCVKQTMLGSNTNVEGSFVEMSVGDYNSLKIS